MRVFFFKKGVIIWGIILLAVIIILLVVLRITEGGSETIKQGLIGIVEGV